MPGRVNRELQPTGFAGVKRSGSVRILLTLLWSAVALAAESGYAQITPLEDVVPLEQFDVRDDDLIRLSTAYVDAMRDLKNAQLSLNTLMALRSNAVITSLELQIASINAQTAEQKVRLLRAIGEKLLAAAEAKLEILRRMENVGRKAQSPDAAGSQNRIKIAQAEATVKILKMMLEPQKNDSLTSANGGR